MYFCSDLGIPQQNGVSVSELQIQLLQKIEELTLYLIQQEQTIQEVRQEVEHELNKGVYSLVTQIDNKNSIHKFSKF